jgi:hypothetical protein
MNTTRQLPPPRRSSSEQQRHHQQSVLTPSPLLEETQQAVNISLIYSSNRRIMSSNPRFSMFLRAVGIKPGFRRTGPSTLLNIAFVSFVGVVSGQYIFKEPLEQYWAEQRQLEQQKQLQGVSAASAPTTNTTTSNHPQQ